jgi:hypothetical protein
MVYTTNIEQVTPSIVDRQSQDNARKIGTWMDAMRQGKFPRRKAVIVYFLLSPDVNAHSPQGIASMPFACQWLSGYQVTPSPFGGAHLSNSNCQPLSLLETILNSVIPSSIYGQTNLFDAKKILHMKLQFEKWATPISFTTCLIQSPRRALVLLPVSH